MLVGRLYNQGEALERTWTAGWKSWSIAYLAAWALFGTGYLLRARRFPKVLTWLGTISFSVYLLHIPLQRTVEPLVGVPPQPSSTLGRIAWTVIYLGIVPTVSYLIYGLVEVPMQCLGRRVQEPADRLRAPTVPVTPSVPATPVAPAVAVTAARMGVPQSATAVGELSAAAPRPARISTRPRVDLLTRDRPASAPD